MPSSPTQTVAAQRRLSLLATSAVAVFGTTTYFLLSSSLRGEVWNITTGLLLVLMMVNIQRFQLDRTRPWLLVWAGLALAYGAGLLVAYGSHLSYEPGSPSLIDAMRLSNYVLAAAGTLFILARYDQRTGARATLEIIMVATTGAMVIWFYVGLPTIESEELTFAQTVVAAAYPLGNVLLLAVIVTVGVRLVHRPGSLILLTLGLAGNLTADFLFNVQNLRGTYETGGWIDFGWLLCFAGLAMGPAWPDPLRGVDKEKLILAVDRTVNISDTSDVLVVVGSAIVSSLAVARLVLHDRPIQELTVVGYQLERVSLALTRGDIDLAKEIIDCAADGLTAQLGELRTIMTNIRPPVLDERGLTGALEDSATQFMRANHATTVIIDSSVRELESDIETVLYRVAQESLTNIARHAGPCAIHLALAEDGGTATLMITDTGRGFRHTDIGRLVANGHYGMAGMRERISMLDGEMHVDSTPSKGTTLRFSVPSSVPAPPHNEPTVAFAGVVQ